MNGLGSFKVMGLNLPEVQSILVAATSFLGLMTSRGLTLLAYMLDSRCQITKDRKTASLIVCKVHANGFCCMIDTKAGVIVVRTICSGCPQILVVANLCWQNLSSSMN